MKGYSDYYCIFLVSFLLFRRFSCVFHFLRNKFALVLQTLARYLQYNVRLMRRKVLLYCILKGFEAIVIFRGYSDSLVFLLIDSLPTKAEPE